MSAQQKDQIRESFQVRICPFKEFQRTRRGQLALNDQFIGILEEEYQERLELKEKEFSFTRPLLTGIHDGKSLSSILSHLTLGPVESAGKARWGWRKEYYHPQGFLQRSLDDIQGAKKETVLNLNTHTSFSSLNFQVEVNNRYLLLEIKEHLRMAVLLPEPLYLIIIELLLGDRKLLPTVLPLEGISL